VRKQGKARLAFTEEGEDAEEAAPQQSAAPQQADIPAGVRERDRDERLERERERHSNGHSPRERDRERDLDRDRDRGRTNEYKSESLDPGANARIIAARLEARLKARQEGGPVPAAHGPMTAAHQSFATSPSALTASAAAAEAARKLGVPTAAAGGSLLYEAPCVMLAEDSNAQEAVVSKPPVPAFAMPALPKSAPFRPPVPFFQKPKMELTYGGAPLRTGLGADEEGQTEGAGSDGRDAHTAGSFATVTSSALPPGLYHCVTVCCSVVQCGAVWCSEVWCVAVCWCLLGLSLQSAPRILHSREV